MMIMTQLKLTSQNMKGHGIHLLESFYEGLANCNQAKAEFLLRSLPPFYSITVENIQTKEYGYDNVVGKLKEYIPNRWKNE